MFNIFDDRINAWFDKRKQDHENKLMTKINQCCTELQECCDQALISSKEDLAEVANRKSDEVKLLVSNEVEMMKEKSASVDFEDLIKKGVESYVHSICEDASPLFFYSEKVLKKEGFELELIDVASFCVKNTMQGHNNDFSYVDVSRSCLDEIRKKASVYGSSIGADVMLEAVSDQRKVDQQDLSYGNIEITYQVVSNFKYYKIDKEKSKKIK